MFSLMFLSRYCKQSSLYRSDGDYYILYIPTDAIRWKAAPEYGFPGKFVNKL